MVDTMSLLRAFLRSASGCLRGSSALGEAGDSSRPAVGLPPDGEVLLDAPDERLAPALVAAARGDHGPAAALLATTREAADWEDRDRYVTRLAAFARSRDEWLLDWCAAAPRDPDALLVEAELAVRRGWESPARAEVLRRVAPLVAEAAECAAGDPVPWRVALDHARGTAARPAEFERLWAEAVRRCPHHYGCHVAALRYLSAACRARTGSSPHALLSPRAPHAPHASRGSRGSRRECLDFAETAAQEAPPGSLMQALPLRAAFACLTAGDGAAVAAGRLHAAADRAIALSSRQAAAAPEPAEVRNLLTYVLVELGRWEDALTQLRMTGPYATSFPWDRISDDPLGAFLTVRDGVRLNAVSPGPPPSVRLLLAHGGHAGRTRFRAH
ncbi:hypothetical protein [Streptomyces sp. NPDC007264]|uniref:hypothetical protein n=1 Tax=Streptomyces sp. NPDC007264 TaxID=3364777 RepID=UPI0036D9235F